ncbi:ParA family protein [Domibacillus epiphyticus]|uniref:Chromosome partitioning protein ParA n=1 Tax=Domibacillus epiphyticus TaxID=1714355 RepID=A0A1V2A7T1_9BACI|nr:AAA family ATPase [Domibacillus epiphyticus]OMP67061.1 chromosome partitioning protein ParA [Domibacillus epiphyticus]
MEQTQTGNENFKIISVFNHKGGVSKTTTTYNIGWKLADKGYKVLLVDGDPQCNLTGLLLKDAFEEYYIGTNKLNNIKDGVRPAFEGAPHPIKAIDCYIPEENENLFLIPGHMDLSEYDPALSLALNSNNAITTLQNLPGSFYELIQLCAHKYSIDYVLIDMNPGLSAINQTFFITSDAFIIPTNPDPFSIMALNTMQKILPRWKQWAITSQPFFETATYPLPQREPKFIGEIIQRFNLRNNKPAAAYSDKITEINDFIEGSFINTLKKFNMIYDIEPAKKLELIDSHCLAQIPEFGALIQRSHEHGVPIFSLNENQLGTTGKVKERMLEKQEEINILFENITNAIVEILK